MLFQTVYSAGDWEGPLMGGRVVSLNTRLATVVQHTRD